MRHNFAQKSLLFVVMLISQSAYAMVPQVSEQTLLDRIEQLTLNQNGTLSDQQLITDIGTFTQLIPEAQATLQAASLPSVSASVVQMSIKFQDAYSEGLIQQEPLANLADYQMQRAVFLAALQKIADLKKEREGAS